MTRVPGDLLCCARSLGLHRGGVGVKPHISTQVGYGGCTPPQPEFTFYNSALRPAETRGFAASAIHINVSVASDHQSSN